MAKKITGARLKKWQADPGLRSKLPDTDLTSSQLKARKLRQRLDTVVAPGGLTNRDVARQANVNTSLQFGGQEQALAQQKAQNQAQATRDQSFFADYVAKINAAKAQAQTDNAAAVGAVQNLGANLDAASAQNWGAQQSQMQADAASRGATVDPRLAQIAQNAATVRSGLVGSYGAMLASQGDTARAGYGNRSLVGLQQGNEQQNVRQSQYADLLKQEQDLKAKEGQFNVSNRSDIISQSTKNYLDQSTAEALNQSRTASAGAAKASAAKTKAETAFLKQYGYYPGKQPSQTEQAKLTYFNAHGYFPPTGPPKSKSGTAKDQYGNTGKDVERNQNSYTRAHSLAVAISGGKNGIKDPDTIYQGLLLKNVTPWIARAAAQQVTKGYVGGVTASRLKTHGVTDGYTRKK